MPSVALTSARCCTHREERRARGRCMQCQVRALTMNEGTPYLTVRSAARMSPCVLWVLPW
jgi:hypothetical protein